MKQACLLLVEKCSLAGMPFHNHPVIGKLQWILNSLFLTFLLPFIDYIGK